MLREYNYDDSNIVQNNYFGSASSTKTCTNMRPFGDNVKIIMSKIWKKYLSVRPENQPGDLRQCF